MIQDIAALFRFIWRMIGAPPLGAEEPRLWRWRLSITVLVMTNLSVTSFVVLVAIGAAPWLFSGFAPNARVTAIAARSDAGDAAQQRLFEQIQTAQLDQQIMDARTRQCAASAARDKDAPDAEQALRFATERVQEKLDEYWRIAGHQYRLPDCSEV